MEPSGKMAMAAVATPATVTATAATTTKAGTEAPAAASTSVRESTGVCVATPEIRWHCGPTGLNEAVLSLDYLHEQDGDSDNNGDGGATPEVVLATGGADKEIKLWRVRRDASAPEFIFSLTGHDRSVNCVRFSPNGQYLASASDDSTVIVWTRPKTAADDWRWHAITSFSDVSRSLLACGHKGDITDLAWSPDSAFLCSTSVDNCAVVWSMAKGEAVERRRDHTQYVQGAAWDPLGEFLVTEGNDRTCRVYSLVGFDTATRQGSGRKSQQRKCANLLTIKSRVFPTATATDTPTTMTATVTVTVTATAETTIPPVGPASTSPAPPQPDALADKPPSAKHGMFLDDTCPVFARRLSWTPDGSYLLAPTGVFRAHADAAPVHTVYAFARGNMSAPTLHLPGHDKASLGVRCSPVLFQLRCDDGEGARSPSSVSNFFQTQYRSVFAVITLDEVIVYDSQQCHPLCTIKNLHYADLTDATWTADGQMLSVSSMDGYVSFVRFPDGFFGVRVPQKELIQEQDTMTTRMFTPSKGSSKKKSKTLPTDEQQAHAKSTSGPKKKKPAITSPLMQAFKKRDAADVSPSANGSDGVSAGSSSTPVTVVNMLQVRKKRKLTPATSATPAATVASASSAVSAPVDLTMDGDEQPGTAKLVIGTAEQLNNQTEAAAAVSAAVSLPDGQ